MTRLHAHEDRSSCVNASVWRVRIVAPSAVLLQIDDYLRSASWKNALERMRSRTVAEQPNRRHEGIEGRSRQPVGVRTTSLLKSIVPTHFVALKPAVM